MISECFCCTPVQPSPLLSQYLPARHHPIMFFATVWHCHWLRSAIHYHLQRFFRGKHCTNLELPGLSGCEDRAAGLHQKVTWTKPFKCILKHFGCNWLSPDPNNTKQSAIDRQATDLFGMGFLDLHLEPTTSFYKCNSHHPSL
jgi:hypothetical protein